MTNIDIAKGLIFQALYIEKDTFDNRLLSQKKIYLLQEIGVDLGYTFNWYIRGPYSPDLTNYIYGNLDILKDYNFSSYQLSETVDKQIERINGLSSSKPDTLTLPAWYELLASIRYITKNWKNEDAFSCLTKYKPQYTKSQFDAACTELKNISCFA